MKVRSLSKIFPNKKGLKKINLDLPQSGIVAVLGPNGSGKSTFFKLVLGLIEPCEGSIEHSFEKIAYVPERRAMYLDLTVEEHFKLIADLKKMKAKELEKTWSKMDDLFALEVIRKNSISTLSKGNQQKVQFALAWMDDPDCFILDEPFTGLDFNNIRFLKEAISKEYQKGKLIFISSHQYDELEDLFTHVMVLNDGYCELFDSLNNLQKNISGYEISFFPDIPDRFKKDAELEFVMREGNAWIYRVKDFKSIQNLVQENIFYRVKIQKISLKRLVEDILG